MRSNAYFNGGQRPAVPAAAILALLAGQALAQGNRPEPNLDLSAQESAAFLDAMAPKNAALLYYQILLQKEKDLSANFQIFNADPDDDADAALPPEEAEALYARSQDYIGRFVHASTLPECDFGVQYENGWEAVLPYLGEMRAAARVLGADAWRHLEQGEPDIAAGRVAAIYNMSRQVAEDRILICSLVGMAIANKGHESTRMLIESGELTEAGRDELITALERLGEQDPFHTRECVKMEGAISIGWLAKKFPEGHASFEGFADGIDPAVARRLASMDGPALIREAERMREYYKQALQVWEDPDASAKLDALGAIVEAGGFGDVAKVFGAAMGKAHDQSLRAEGQLADTLEALRAYRPDEPTDTKSGTATEPTSKR